MSLLADITVVQQSPSPERAPSRGGRWMQVVSHLDPKYGGLSAAVPELASALTEYSGHTASLACFCAPDETAGSTRHPELTISRWPLGRMEWIRNRSVVQHFIAAVSGSDGVHIHGIWEQSTAVACRTARGLQKPYILSAHGMLDPWALRNKRLKKVIYAALTERANVRGAACLHALTRSEARDYRAFGAAAPIAIIPNGVSVPQNLSSDAFFEQFPALRGKRIVLFLSRIHFKKGLDLLVEAWRTVAQTFPDAHLVLAGPDFEGTRAKIETLVAGHQLTQSVTFTGMLGGDLKWSALAAAHCFVLPSYSEGLSVATLEAMGCGVPVVITEQCNLPEVSTFGAGWVIPPDAQRLRHSLDECLENTAEANRRIGERGRALVQERYSWPMIAQQMAEVYDWVLGGPVPQTVDLIGGAV